MASENIKYRILETRTEIAVVELGKNVLGGSEALEFTSVLDELSHSPVKIIAADLSNVELMNSSGLGMLVNGLNSVKKHDKAFVLASVPAKVEKLLKMTHLDEVFTIYSGIDSI